MQNENKKHAFRSGLMSALAFMSRLMAMNKRAKLAERFKLGVFSPKRRHIHMDGGPLPHSMNVKKFVGCRNAARRARRYILTTPAFMTRTTKDTNADLGEFKDKSGTPYVRRADGSVVSVWIRQLREQGHTRHAAKQIIREAIYVDGDIS